MAAQAKGTDRPKRLVYLGGQPNGHDVTSYFQGVPARDLDEPEVAGLSDEKYALITAAHPTLGPLYAASKTAAKDAPVVEAPAVVPPGEKPPVARVEGAFGDEGNLRPDGGSK